MAQLLSEVTTDWSAGMIDSAAPTAYPKTAAAALYNARIQSDGTLQRRPGSKRMHTTALNAATGYGASRFRTAAGDDQIVVIFGDQAFVSTDEGATWSAACQQGAGVNTCVYDSGAHTITTVMDSGIAGTHTWDLSGITGTMTMTPVVTGSPIATCVSTDNAGTYTAGAIKVTVNGVLYTQAYVTTKNDTLTALAAQIQTVWREDYYSFATMRVGATNYLFAANGDTTIKRWNGTTWDTLPNAPSGVKYIAVFNGRLYVAGHSGVIMQGSAIGAPTNWTSPDAVTVQILSHSGDVPVGLYQIGPHLLVFDRHATSYIDGYGEQSLVVATGATGFSRSVGCAGFRSVVGVGDNAVCWMSERGVEYYSPNGGIQLLSKSVQGFLQGVDWSELYLNPGRMSACYDDINQDYHLALSTSGARNNRVLVLNLLQEVQYQRSGPRGSATIDVLFSPVGGDVLLGSDDGIYLSNESDGDQVESDVDGYMALAAGAGVTLSGDVDSYLRVITNDALPATLFTAPSEDRATVVYSLGYDGFVRRHLDATADDMLSNGTGGTDVTMTVVSRPFLMGRARQRKRVRTIHMSVVSDDDVSLLVAVRGGGVEAEQHSVTFAGTALGQSRRKRVMTHVIADEPQVAAYVDSDAKVSLLGISAELLREAV